MACGHYQLQARGGRDPAEARLAYVSMALRRLRPHVGLADRVGRPGQPGRRRRASMSRRTACVRRARGTSPSPIDAGHPPGVDTGPSIGISHQDDAQRDDLGDVGPNSARHITRLGLRSPTLAITTAETREEHADDHRADQHADTAPGARRRTAATTPSTRPPATSASQQSFRWPSDQTPPDLLRSATAAASEMDRSTCPSLPSLGSRLMRPARKIPTGPAVAAVPLAPEFRRRRPSPRRPRAARRRVSRLARIRGHTETDHGDHDADRDRDDGHLPRQEHQRHRAAGEHDRPQVEDQHRLPVGVADRQHPVVQVLLVGAERVPALLGAPDHGQQEVQHRDEHDGQRDDQRREQGDGRRGGRRSTTGRACRRR